MPPPTHSRMCWPFKWLSGSFATPRGIPIARTGSLAYPMHPTRLNRRGHDTRPSWSYAHTRLARRRTSPCGAAGTRRRLRCRMPNYWRLRGSGPARPRRGGRPRANCWLPTAHCACCSKTTRPALPVLPGLGPAPRLQAGRGSGTRPPPPGRRGSYVARSSPTRPAAGRYFSQRLRGRGGTKPSPRCSSTPATVRWPSRNCSRGTCRWCRSAPARSRPPRPVPQRGRGDRRPQPPFPGGRRAFRRRPRGHRPPETGAGPGRGPPAGSFCGRRRAGGVAGVAGMGLSAYR